MMTVILRVSVLIYVSLAEFKYRRVTCCFVIHLAMKNRRCCRIRFARHINNDFVPNAWIHRDFLLDVCVISAEKALHWQWELINDLAYSLNEFPIEITLQLKGIFRPRKINKHSFEREQIYSSYLFEYIHTLNFLIDKRFELLHFMLITIF